MPITSITVRGARHPPPNPGNNIDDRNPCNTLTVITGLRRSGSLHWHSHDLRRGPAPLRRDPFPPTPASFSTRLERPDVDGIRRPQPSISIEQKTTSRSPRSTVGTIPKSSGLSSPFVRFHRQAACPTAGKESPASGRPESSSSSRPQA